MDINRALPNGQPAAIAIPAGSAADVVLRNWITTLVRNHEALGVQRVLYKTINWRCDRGYQAPSATLTRLHMNHMHVEQTRQAAATLTNLRIAQVLGGANIPIPAPPLPTEDEMRRAVMVPGGRPNSVGRWPYWMLTATGEDIVSCNGAPALQGAALVLGSPVVPIPKPHRPIIGIEPAPDGNGVIACADDQSTYTFRKA